MHVNDVFPPMKKNNRSSVRKSSGQSFIKCGYTFQTEHTEVQESSRIGKSHERAQSGHTFATVHFAQ